MTKFDEQTINLTLEEKERIAALIEHLIFVLDMASDDPDLEDDDPAEDDDADEQDYRDVMFDPYFRPGGIFHA